MTKELPKTIEELEELRDVMSEIWMKQQKEIYMLRTQVDEARKTSDDWKSMTWQLLDALCKYRQECTKYCGYPAETETSTLKESGAKVKDLCIEGLLTDGGHHKQWYLERILKACGFSLEDIIRELKEEDYEWESGIAP